MAVVDEFTGSAPQRRTQEAGAAARGELQGAFGSAQTALQPFLNVGPGALARLSAGLEPGGEFGVDPSEFAFDPTTVTQDPGFQFRLSQGLGGIERGAAARGKLLSGQTLKGLTEFGQNLASQEFAAAHQRGLAENQLAYERAVRADEAQFGRLSSLAGIGERGAGSLASLYRDLGSQQANSLIAQAAAENRAAEAGTQRVAGVVGSLASSALASKAGGAVAGGTAAGGAGAATGVGGTSGAGGFVGTGSGVGTFTGGGAAAGGGGTAAGGTGTAASGGFMSSYGWVPWAVLASVVANSGLGRKEGFDFETRNQSLSDPLGQGQRYAREDPFRLATIGGDPGDRETLIESTRGKGLEQVPLAAVKVPLQQTKRAARKVKDALGL